MRTGERAQAFTPEQRQQVLSRLWSKTKVQDESGCWIWQGAKNATGYGMISVNGRMWVVSRLSLVLVVGELPRTQFACHRCDTPPCWNPDHLFEGTAGENNADKHAKGRAVVTGGLKGEKAQAAYDMYWSEKLPLTKIARHFGVSVSAVDTAIQRVEKEGWESMARDERMAARDAARLKRGYEY